ncbi:MAG TPA: MGMT family protein, partial [Candidatus Marinimicrobia bacterium]|nr:MGMT family protein [Candidatus Neomarinimicrobiota bacterium]
RAFATFLSRVTFSLNLFCHRIISSNGNLGGYGGGLGVKKYLLDLEARNR